MIKEFCAENFTDIPQAVAAGANRIELCDNLAVGGTTPSYGVIEAVCRFTSQYQVPVMTMIRPRGGNFVYQKEEVDIMACDIEMAIKAGSDGLVFGCLTEDGQLDTIAMERLLAIAGTKSVVFHMAFDAIPKERQLEALDWLSEHGVQRILTHGGPATSPIEEHLSWLKQLYQYADGRIELLIGGGVTGTNVENLVTAVGTNQAHGTKILIQ